jgi:hypothetical protein
MSITRIVAKRIGGGRQKLPLVDVGGTAPSAYLLVDQDGVQWKGC